MVFPPRPNNITIPAVVAGNILQSDDTSISVIDAGNDGAIVMRTQNTLAMMINPLQQTLINTENAFGMLNINSDIGTVPVIRMSYQDNRYCDITMNNTGIRVSPSADDPTIDSVMATEFDHDVDIADHDGGTKGLKLHGVLVTASGSELNFVDVPAGVARANRAMVLDTNLNIATINRLDANQISGTLITTHQPNITTLDTINITGALSIQGVPFDIDLTTLQYLQIPNHDEGIAYASKALILNHDRSITNIRSISANTISGVLTAGPQPNITSLSALTALNNNGTTQLHGTTSIITDGDTQLVLGWDTNTISTLTTNSYGNLTIAANGAMVKIDGGSLQISGHNGSTQGLMLGNNLVVATAGQLNTTAVQAGTATASKALVLDASKNISGINGIVANTVSATIVIGNQPYISTVSTLNITNHNGSTNGLSLNGVLVLSSATELNYVNVPPGIAQAFKSVILNSTKSITGLGTLGADNLDGVLTTPVQPNISTVQTLTITNHNGSTTGLTLGSTLVLATANQLNYLQVVTGVADANKALVLNNSKNVYGINNISAATFTGVVSTAIQPNINQVDTLNIATHNGVDTGLLLGGTLVTATASELNYLDVTQGHASARKALVLDSAGGIVNINTVGASYLQGMLTTASQPQLTQVNTLNIADHNANNAGLALAGDMITVSAAQINALDVGAGTAAGGKVLRLDGSRSISNINTLMATSIYGEIETGNQPYISSVSSLNIANHNGNNAGLSLGGILVQTSAAQLNYLLITTLGQAQANCALTTNAIKNIEGINMLAATTIAGTLTTNQQPNITQVNTLNIANHNGITGLSLAGTIITASANQINRLDTNVGSVQAGKVMIVDTLLNITNINSLGANSLTGIINTASQPYITSVGTLNITNHDGGSSGLALRGTLVGATAAQLNYTIVVPGTASSNRAVVTDAYNSVSGINNMTVQQLTASRLSLSGIISNFNTGALIIKTYSFVNLIGRLISTQLITSTVFSSFVPADNVTSGFSCEIFGYILPPASQNYTFYVTCNDRVRLWVNGSLLLHSWIATSNSRTSSSIYLNGSQWVPIYIQYQVDPSSIASFSLQWSSTSFIQMNITSQQLAWDNNPPACHLNMVSQDSFMIYNTNVGTQNTTKFSVDTGGNMTIDASGNNIILGANDNFNIPAHDGTANGLMLGGVLVLPTAYEINYLKVSPGTISASHALVVDASKSITGINSLQATSVSCSNLTSDTFTISNLALNGPLNNYNSGALLIRQITGPNASGRVVNVDVISSINFITYDPRSLNYNYSIDISGYINATSSDLHTFYATASGYVRIWVNDTLVLNAFGSTTNIEYASNQISLTQGQWVPFYIQFQSISTSSTIVASLLKVQWSTSLITKQYINSANMAWDNTSVKAVRPLIGLNQMTVVNSSSNLSTLETGTIGVDITGNMALSSSSNTVSIASGNDFNIVSHNGTHGLILSGSLVTATATELNYLAGVSPGVATIGKALILNNAGSLTGFTLLGGTSISGALTTPAQPNITSIGTLASTLNTNADIVISNNNHLHLSADATACYIQAGSNITADSSADLFIGNYAATIAASSRKLMIKANGNVGIQTSAPAKALTVNGGGSTYCMRLINNSSNGSETNYMDIGIDTSANMILGSTGSGTATIGVSTAGIMKIIPSGGSLQIGNTSNSALPLEIGAANYTISSTVGYLNSAGSVGTVIPADVSYSLRTSGSIIVNGTVCITSDRRLKRDIDPLDVQECKNFIMSNTAVSFRYTEDNTKRLHCGLIAQDVIKGDFPNIVNIAPCPGINRDCIDGVASPEGAAFNVSYTEIVPILMTAIKDVIDENTQLKKRLDRLEALIEDLNTRYDQYSDTDI